MCCIVCASVSALSACAPRPAARAIPVTQIAPAFTANTLTSPLAAAQPTATSTPPPSPTPRPTATTAALASPLATPATRVLAPGDIQASFGMGALFQTVNADGERVIEYQIDTVHSEAKGDLVWPQAITLTASIYAVPDAAFLKAIVLTAIDQSASYRWTSSDVQRLKRVRTWTINTRLASGTNVYSLNRKVMSFKLPADLPAGAFALALNVGAAQPTDDIANILLINITRQALIAKQGNGALDVFVSDMAGVPQPSAPVEVFDSDLRRLTGGISDATGRASLPISDTRNARAVLARIGPNDVAFIGVAGAWRSQDGRWYWGDDTRLKPRRFHTVIHTERPIYQPGQTVFFKGYLRKDDDAVLSLPATGMTATVRVRDGRNNIVSTRQFRTNDFGAFDGSFAIADGAALGDWSIEAERDGARSKHTFGVQTYRKPDFKVGISLVQTDVLRSQAISGTIDAAYLLGRPVVSASVQVVLHSLAPPWCMFWQWEDADCEEDYSWNRYDEYSFIRQDVRTNGDGLSQFAFSAPATTNTDDTWWGVQNRPQLVAIEAIVDDGSAQPVSTFVIARVFASAEFAKFEQSWDAWYQNAGKPIVSRIQVTDQAGAAVSKRSVRITTTSDATAYGYDSADGNQPEQIAPVNVLTDEDGWLTHTITAATSGGYSIRAEALDALGNPYAATRWIWVNDSNKTTTAEFDGRLSISTDRTSAKPGERVRVRIGSSVAGPALLSVERGKVRRSTPIQLDAAVTEIEVPIEMDDAPNVFIRVNQWQPRPDHRIVDRSTFARAAHRDLVLRSGQVEVSVASSAQTLNIAIDADQSVLRPRETARFALRVTDATGNPVEAELALALVDESIYLLGGNNGKPLLERFYARRKHQVIDHDSSAAIRFFDTSDMGGGGGGGAAESNPRTDFPDTAIWLPSVRTDADGRASVDVRLPDSLTTWRLTALAVTGGAQAGDGMLKIRTEQPLVLRPILPADLVAGDTAVLSVLAHNTTDVDREVSLALPLNDARLSLVNAAPTQTLVIPANATRIVGWSARISGSGTLTFAVRGVDSLDDSVADAIEVPLTIRPLAVMDLSAESGVLSGDASAVITASFPLDALPESVIEIDVQRSIAGNLLSGLDYLTGYPYGCVEQTMSRALPNAVIARAAATLGIDRSQLADGLDGKVEASLQRLYGLQHDDGGWGWWYDDQTDVYQTAWVLFGLATMRDAGAEVDPGVIERAAQWLVPQLSSADPRTAAFGHYSLALAGNGDDAGRRALRAQADKLDGFALSALALTAHKRGDAADARAWLALLKREINIDEVARSASVGLVKDDGAYHDKTMASRTRSTALALSALTAIKADPELAAYLARYLMDTRAERGFGTTNETAFAILGLADHLASQQPIDANSDYALAAQEVPLARGSLTRANTSDAITLTQRLIGQVTQTLTLSHQGAGQMFVTVRRRMVLARERIAASGPVSVTRKIERADGAPLDGVQRGDVVRVTLRVKLDKPASFLMIQDNLPAGFEAINEGLNISSRMPQGNQQQEEFWWQWNRLGYNYKEIRGGRVTFFKTEAQGEFTIRYYARATHSGRFVAMPAEVSAMYDASVWGRSESTVVGVNTGM